MSIKEQTFQLIDALKLTCTAYGLGNDGNEYKIITQIFLYKFLNDKFGYEIKKISPELAAADPAVKRWEAIYSYMTEDERLDLWDAMSPDLPRLKPEHLIANLWNQSSKGDFDLIFDATMRDIADENIEIFNTHTTEETKIPIFENLTIFVTDTSQRSAFAKALVDKLVNFSFEEVFGEKYDFFSDIFEYLIKDYNNAGGGKYAEYYTPKSIANIMARLLVGDNANLHSVQCYDPSAGTGTLLMALAHQIGEDKCTIFSQDISQRSNKMLKLNLILNGLVASLDNAIQGDTLVSPYHKSEDGKKLKQFDFIVSNPPFKLDFVDTYSDIVAQPARFWAGVPNKVKKINPQKPSMSIYLCFLQHVINSLKDNVGKGAIVVPTGFITSKQKIEQNILKKVVDEKIVYGCISMPSNVFATTGTNVSVLFFDKSKKHDKVILIDASKLGEEYKEGNNQKRRLLTEEIDLIVDTFNTQKSIDDFSVAVTYDEIKEKGYYLSAGQYFDIKIDYVDITAEEFNMRMTEYKNKLTELFDESHRLEGEIIKQMNQLHFNE
ncbi:MAG: class I SAM-dependent DNA methyltransferase [Candidatus Cryptobacteroides sp.]